MYHSLCRSYHSYFADGGILAKLYFFHYSDSLSWNPWMLQIEVAELMAWGIVLGKGVCSLDFIDMLGGWPKVSDCSLGFGIFVFFLSLMVLRPSFNLSNKASNSASIDNPFPVVLRASVNQLIYDLQNPPNSHLTQISQQVKIRLRTPPEGGRIYRILDGVFSNYQNQSFPDLCG